MNKGSMGSSFGGASKMGGALGGGAMKSGGMGSSFGGASKMGGGPGMSGGLGKSSFG